MSIYQEIESAYILATRKLKDGGDPKARERAMGVALDRQVGISKDDEINVRLYFNAKKTLVGLDEWAASK